MLTETSLLVDWFWPAVHGTPAPKPLRQEYFGLWRPLLEHATKADSGWVVRDYHSPNLMWLPERKSALNFRSPLLSRSPRLGYVP